MRQVTVFTSDNDYQNFLELAKNLRYVEKIVESPEYSDSENDREDWVPNDDNIKTLEKAMSQDKKTFLSRNDISTKYSL